MPDYPSRFALTGKRALVTGASRGLGAEVAAVLADAGADLALVARDRAGLDATRAAVVAQGRRAIAIEADLATINGPRHAAAAALDFFGTIDILVNNAGIFHRHSLLDTTPEQWDETQAVNLRAPFLLAQALAPGMIEQATGKIINVSTVAQPRRLRRPRVVRRVEGRAEHAHARDGDRVGPARHPNERDRPVHRADRHGPPGLERRTKERPDQEPHARPPLRRTNRNRRPRALSRVAGR